MLFSNYSSCESKISKISLLKCAVLSKKISKSIEGIISLSSPEVRKSINTYLDYKSQRVRDIVGLNINMSELKEILAYLLREKKIFLMI